MNARESRHGPAGAEQADALAVLGEHRLELVEGAAHALSHSLVCLDPVFALERLPAFAFGQRNDAPWRAPPTPDPGHPAHLVDQHQLGRTAADVEDQRRAVAGLQQFVAAEHREPSFFRGFDNLERDPGLVADPFEELAAVGCTAAGFGRDRAGQGDVAAAKLVGADRQRADRTVHGVVGQLPALRKPVAEAHDPRESVDHREAPIGRAGDEQAAVVGAEVERSVSMTLLVRLDGPPIRGAWEGRLVPRVRRRRAGDILRHQQRPFLSCTAGHTGG